MSEEALVCFNTLLESIPGWIADLEALVGTVAARQEEIIFANQPSEPAPEPSAGGRASISSLLRSRRSKNESGKADIQTTQHPQLKRLTNSDALRLSQRKRKTVSVCSGDQSGPIKYRIKTAAVVFYDGETQKHFERLVQAVGSSRNSIRKGKMSARVAGLARLGSSGSNGSSSDSSLDHKDDYSPIRLNFMSTRGSAFPLGDATTAFDQVDGQLERAQEMCERAAHQILRDGDCTVEVKNAKEHLAEALRMTESEMPNLQRSADRAAARRKRSEERRRVDVEAEERRKSATQRGDRIIGVVTRSSTSSPFNVQLEVDELEVDDESDDDEGGDFDISAMRSRFGNFASMRSSRLAAH